ncbi:MAG TPA: hypothetical protein VGC97_06910 [Pyrinomonadaceae bacterium]|jgi:hypothetical protein
MCKRIPVKKKLGENRHRRGDTVIFNQFLLPTKLIVVLFILLIIPANAFSQRNSVLNVQSVIKAAKLKYRLTVKDINLLLPLIRQENFEILNIYARLSETENGYSQVLWNDIIVSRCEFETRIKGKLTRRQELVLRTVRADMEEQILNILVDEYIEFLGGYLEFDRFELERIGNLFDQECKRKHRLIIMKLANITLLQIEIEKINFETKAEIQKILSPIQFRMYLMLSTQDEFIAE